MITFYFIVYLSPGQDRSHLFRKQVKKPMPITEELTRATLTLTCSALAIRMLTLRDISGG